MAGDSVASFLEGSSFEYGPLDIVADYDVSAILSGQPTTIEISWQVIDRGNMALATSLLTLECGSVVEGCMDELACNYSPSATEKMSCLYLDDCLVCGGDNSSCRGVDSQACNCNDTNRVLSDPTLCDYSCCPGPGCQWSGNNMELANLNVRWPTLPTQTSMVASSLRSPRPLNGTAIAVAEESPWQCGEPLEYQHDYATVLIGDQCWFAENLRNDNYDNGDAISSTLATANGRRPSCGGVRKMKAILSWH